MLQAAALSNTDEHQASSMLVEAWVRVKSVRLHPGLLDDTDAPHVGLSDCSV